MHNFDRVSIIGAGTLGSNIAYSLTLLHLAKEILLVDMSQHIVQGQVLDLTQAILPGRDITVRSGTFKEAGQSSLIIVTADTPQHHNETRASWLVRSRQLLISIGSSMSPVKEDATILIVSNPVDLYVQSFQNYFPHIPSERIFGVGAATTMATLQFQTWLMQMMSSERLVKKVKVEDTYCIGHEDNPVTVWDYAKVDGVNVSALPNLVAHKSGLDAAVSTRRFELICERKGEAGYGLAATVTAIVQSMISKGKIADSKISQQFWVVSVRVPQYDACISWPVVIENGQISKLLDLPLALQENQKVLHGVEKSIQDYKMSIL